MISLGEVRREGAACALLFTREYAASAAEVWSAITEPARTVRWLGEIRGTPAVGETVLLLMGDGEDERATIRITECRRPARIAADWVFPGEPATRLVVQLVERAPDRTLVTLEHSGFPADQVAGYGCGWQHYVDSLAAHLTGEPLPSFADYYPAMLDEWRARVPAQAE